MESDAAMAEASGANPVPSLVYYEKSLKFPRDLKNDIIYCQRALKAHIRVHQKIVEMFRKQKSADHEEMKNVLNEIESEIFEINAEQNYLFLRLRRIVHEHNKTLKALKMPINPFTTNQIIAKEVMPFINDESQNFYPSSVHTRTNEANLMYRYYKFFHRIEPKVVYEISDSEEEVELEPTNKHALNPNNQLNGQAPQPLTKQYNGHSGSVKKVLPPQPQPQQTSLLKPIAQRMVSTATTYGDAMQFLQIDMQEELMHAETAVEDPAEVPVSKNVTRSRLNLRQALKKARTETLVSKALLTAEDKKPVMAVASPTVNAAQPAAKKYETRTKGSRNSTAAKSPELNSSSENSNPESERSLPLQSMSPLEAVEFRTRREDYVMDDFLSLFGLYTPAAISQMQQRRSKRTRRTVHSNERADFHYGRIDYANLDGSEENKKKRKEFLVSPQVKRNLQTKRAKIERVPSRSSSSSPEEKRACNECLKGGGSFNQCGECKGYYHQQCHREEDDAQPNSIRRALTISKANLCPACKRAEQKLLKKETALTSTAQQLELKYAKEKSRRANLQEQSKEYKIQMSNLFSIVKLIKTNGETDEGVAEGSDYEDEEN